MGAAVLGASALPGALAGCSGDAARPTGERKAIVIGSGFGGAVAALRLAEAGVRVTLLERGMAWPIEDDGDTFSLSLNADRRSTWLRDRTVAPLGPAFRIERHLGVLAREDFDTMKVYTGAGLGGGSLVYGCMTVQPTEAIFQRVFGSDLSWSSMDGHWFPLVRRMLGAEPVPQDIFEAPFYEMSQRFAETCMDAGVRTELIDLATDWAVVRAEMEGARRPSAILGELLYGGNSGYKNSLDRTYLEAAAATGFLEVRTQHEVVRIDRSQRGTWIADVQVLEADGSVASTDTFEADMLFLGAGSLGTTRLLLRMQREGRLVGLPNTLGEQWGANGNAMFMRSNLRFGTGRMQANPPIMAAFDLDNPHTAIVVENAPFPIGFDCNCLLQLAVSDDPQRGRLELDDRGESLQLEWPEHSHEATLRAVEDFATRMEAHDGGTLGHPWLREVTKDFTYHPLGGAAMNHVCDTFGRVAGEPGLYVVDSALIPGNTACSNPSLAIAAVAERALDTIVRQDLRRLG